MPEPTTSDGTRPVIASPTSQALCERSSCRRPLLRRAGPGRPPRFCSDQCRHIARRDRAASLRSLLQAPRTTSRFNTAFRDAVRHSGLTLQQISALLRQQDKIGVGRSTLSSWQCNTTPQRGPLEDRRILAVERVLQLRRGKLLLLLDEDAAYADADAGPPAQTSGDAEVQSLRARAGQLGGVRNVITTAVEDTLLVLRRRPEHLTVRQTVLAVGPDVDCYWTVYSPDAAAPQSLIEPMQGCRVGRKVSQSDLIAVELLFDRILQPGQSHTFTFRVGEAQLTTPVRHFRRWAGPPALEHLHLTIHFQDSPLPRQVLACEWINREQLARPGRPVPIVDGVARLRMPHPPAGMYGLAWAW